MRKFWMIIAMAIILAMGAGTVNNVMAQYDYEYETVAPDTLSIDDMDPILYSDDDYVAAEKSNNTGLVIGIIVIAVVAGLIVFKVVSGKKKE
ncbi:hypothetical protein [Alkalitalea saponilacus]|uniref:Cobalt/nickel transport protein n=1 Tax=Alkalitalea saponilacus TaxID=889453 RepID=A0A1T5HN26_9BACT|nr:hypothetical protein [Alkalitalea saponilacus]ASB49363.1 hypothetical protein CDL62_09520 [Alkalitalea saponilacus]SKC22079.1 hypothetical protein SAMN03080601_02504 [Alkalitalea saponilacus]